MRWRRRWPRAGYPPRWQPTLERLVADVLDTPLDGHGAAPARHLARAAARRAGVLLSAGAHRGRHAEPPAGAPPPLAAEAAALRFDAVEGVLKGYIDLVFEHAGRFYLADYKSNWLGPTRGGLRARGAARGHGRAPLRPAVPGLHGGAAPLSAPAPAGLRLRAPLRRRRITCSCAAWRRGRATPAFTSTGRPPAWCGRSKPPCAGAPDGRAPARPLQQARALRPLDAHFADLLLRHAARAVAGTGAGRRAGQPSHRRGPRVPAAGALRRSGAVRRHSPGARRRWPTGARRCWAVAWSASRAQPRR